MDFFAVLMTAFSILGAADKIIGNRFGLGAQFEEGFKIFGISALSVIGMLILAPLLSRLLEPAYDFISKTLHLEPSILPASLFANDMGGAALSAAAATDATLGKFNGLVVSTMMGVTISFTIPVALTTVKKEQHKDVLLGFLCGIVTVPAGCIFGGLFMGLPILTILWDLIPLLVFSALLALGLFFFPNACVKVFQIFGLLIRTLITVGLVFGILEYMLSWRPIDGLDPFQDAANICVRACVVMSGAFPFIYVLSRLLARPLRWFGGKLGINPVSASGFLASMATSVTTYSLMKVMDRKGVILNSAFAISGAFVFAAHLAFTMATDSTVILPMIMGKLFGGVCAVILANFMQKRTAGN